VSPGAGLAAEGREIGDSAATEALAREEPDFDFRLVEPTTFAEHGGKTQLTLHTLQTSAVGFEAEAAPKLAGIEEGWAQSLDRLAEHVAR